MRSSLAVQGAYFEKDIQTLNSTDDSEKNFRFFELLKLLKNFCSGLTNSFLKKNIGTGASF